MIARFSEDKTKFDDPEEWLKANYSEAPIFKSFDEIWNKVKGNYETDFRLLVHGEFPGESLIAEQIKALLKSLE